MTNLRFFHGGAQFCIGGATFSGLRGVQTFFRGVCTPSNHISIQIKSQKINVQQFILNHTKILNLFSKIYNSSFRFFHYNLSGIILVVKYIFIQTKNQKIKRFKMYGKSRECPNILILPSKIHRSVFIY